MEKHHLNIMPDMAKEDYQSLKEDIKNNGFDDKYPIYLYEGKILDGWHRYNVCYELGIEPVYKTFEGSKFEALNLVVRSETRRHATSSQKAAVAVKTDEVFNTIKEETERERREKQAETLKDTHKKGDFGVSRKNLRQTKQFEPEENSQKEETEHKQKEAKETRQKAANMFGTNRSYIDQAQRLKKENPEYLEKIANGEKTFSDLKKEEKQQKIKQEKKQRKVKEPKYKAYIYNEDAKDFLERFDRKSIDLLLTDPPYSTDIDNLQEFLDFWLFETLEKIKDSGRAFICIGAYPNEIQTYISMLQKTDWIIDCPLVWTYKNTLGQTPKMKYNLNYQMILHLYKETSRKLNNNITNEMFSVQEINAPDGRQGDRYFKWQKPDKLANQLINHSTKEKDIIIDPFAGSGSFILQAANNNRSAYGSEVNKEVLNIAKNRGCYEI